MNLLNTVGGTRITAKCWHAIGHISLTLLLASLAAIGQPALAATGFAAAGFHRLAAECAPLVHPATAHALVSVESRFNPYAIGVVGGMLQRQPRNRTEALATVAQLQTQGWNFSIGLAQINRANLLRVGLTPTTAFEPCANLRAMQAVMVECFSRAAGQPPLPSPQLALRRALSCYYSGNFTTGIQHGYVRRVIATAQPLGQVDDRNQAAAHR
jgi:type IV secretion system protein VirB1